MSSYLKMLAAAVQTYLIYHTKDKNSAHPLFLLLRKKYFFSDGLFSNQETYCLCGGLSSAAKVLTVQMS